MNVPITLNDIFQYITGNITNFGNALRGQREAGTRLSTGSGSPQDLRRLLEMAAMFAPAGITKGAKGLGEAFLAKAGQLPLTSLHKLLPALLDPRTGKIASAKAPGIGAHDVLRKAFPKDALTERAFVDPATGLTFTEKMMEEIERGGFGFGLK